MLTTQELSMIELATTLEQPKPLNKAQRIREYIAANPTVVAKDVATNLGVGLQYVYTVMYKVKAKTKAKVKKPRKVTKKLGRPRKNVDLTPALKFLEGRAQAQKEDWKQLGLFSSNIPMVKDTVTNTTPSRMAQLAYEAGKATAKLRMEGDRGDAVNNPAHYKVGGIETIDFIEAKKLGYNLGNVVKYITRADHKDNKLEDLRKAQWYLTREINSLK
jgi:hypothetical protein